jgi:hypothetical protein
MPSAALLVTLALTNPVIAVEGDAECPSPEAVSVELSRILRPPTSMSSTSPIQPTSDPSARAVVSRRELTIQVALRTKDGRLVGEREVTAEGSCEELARAVAVILGAWFTDTHPEYATPLPPAEPPEQPPPRTPEPAAADLPPAAAPVSASGAARAPSASPRKLRWSFGVGAGIELSDAGVVPAFEPSLRLAPEAGVGAMAFALLAFPATYQLGAGEASVFRWPLGVGPLLRLASGPLALDLALGPHLGWLHARGTGFTTRGEADDIALGVFGAVRLMGRWSFARPFVGLTALGWLSRATLTSQLPDATLDLPVVEGVFVLGLSVPR